MLALYLRMSFLIENVELRNTLYNVSSRARITLTGSYRSSWLMTFERLKRCKKNKCLISSASLLPFLHAYIWTC